MASASRLENEGSKNPNGESGAKEKDERVLKEQAEPVSGLWTRLDAQNNGGTR